MKPNADIRNLIRIYGFSSWQLASKLSIHENSLYRMLRRELDDQEKKLIYQALDQLKEEREAEISKISDSHDITAS